MWLTKAEMAEDSASLGTIASIGTRRAHAKHVLLCHFIQAFVYLVPYRDRRPFAADSCLPRGQCGPLSWSSDVRFGRVQSADVLQLHSSHGWLIRLTLGDGADFPGMSTFLRSLALLTFPNSR